MRKLIDKSALEQLLQRNWTSFIDRTRLVAFLMQQVRDADLPKVEGDTSNRNQGIKITVSNVELTDNGVLLWVDFSIPTNANTVSAGTCEVTLSSNGEVDAQQLVGTITETK